MEEAGEAMQAQAESSLHLSSGYGNKVGIKKKNQSKLLDSGMLTHANPGWRA